MKPPHEIEEYLATAPIVGNWHWRTDDIWDAETQGGRLFIKTRGVQGECAAWLLAKALGPAFSSILHPMVARSVTIDGEERAAAVGPLLPDEAVVTPPLDVFDPADLLAAAVFDALVLHAERRDRNWMGIPGSPHWQLQLIDHEDNHVFAISLVGLPASVFHVRHAGAPIPAHLAECLARLAGWLTAGDPEVNELSRAVGTGAMGTLFARAQLMLREGRVLPVAYVTEERPPPVRKWQRPLTGGGTDAEAERIANALHIVAEARRLARD